MEDLASESHESMDSGVFSWLSASSKSSSNNNIKETVAAAAFHAQTTSLPAAIDNSAIDLHQNSNYWNSDSQGTSTVVLGYNTRHEDSSAANNQNSTTKTLRKARSAPSMKVSRDEDDASVCPAIARRRRHRLIEDSKTAAHAPADAVDVTIMHIPTVVQISSKHERSRHSLSVRRTQSDLSGMIVDSAQTPFAQMPPPPPYPFPTKTTFPVRLSTPSPSPICSPSSSLPNSNHSQTSPLPHYVQNLQRRMAEEAKRKQSMEEDDLLLAVRLHQEEIYLANSSSMSKSLSRSNSSYGSHRSPSAQHIPLSRTSSLASFTSSPPSSLTSTPNSSFYMARPVHASPSQVLPPSLPRSPSSLNPTHNNFSFTHIPPNNNTTPVSHIQGISEGSSVQHESTMDTAMKLAIQASLSSYQQETQSRRQSRTMSPTTMMASKIQNNSNFVQAIHTDADLDLALQLSVIDEETRQRKMQLHDRLSVSRAILASLDISPQTSPADL